jgi:hypothetical protein
MASTKPGVHWSSRRRDLAAAEATAGTEDAVPI